jgi:Protein of unknown function (DUF3179)
MRRWIAVVVMLTVLAAACAAEESQPEFDDYPDAVTRRLNRLLAEPRPVENSALPPRHLDLERFPESLVDRFDIVSGGPPPDGIASIDEPSFESASTVDWLTDTEPVLSFVFMGEARAYPLRIMNVHELVNDVVAGTPILISYCPLCNSAVALARTIDGEPVEFGTSGSLYRSALVMYDRATESLWTHFDGRAVIGDLIGTELEKFPVQTVSFADFREANPDGDVLEAPRALGYGRNPYPNYDQRDGPVNAFFRADVDPRTDPMTRVVGVGDGSPVAIPRQVVEVAGVLEIEIDGAPATVWHSPGTTSALDAPQVADGRDIGAVAAYLTTDTFERTADGFIDEATGSTWNILGVAIAGPRRGEQLQPVTYLDTFWFAWSAYFPDTDLLD